MVLRMPEELVARARLLAQGGRWESPTAVDAATVVLLREGSAGPQALLMRRPDSMAFAPGMYVFPGGRVDLPDDSRPAVHGTVALAPGTDPAIARALVVAGVRETFEEAGVLLATDRWGRPAMPDERWEPDRRDCERGAAFAAILARRGLRIDADRLVPVAHWITPEVETRRYDTRFLLASLPAGQEVSAHETETDSAHWLDPGDALAEHQAGRLALLPPTIAVLERLTAVRSVPEAFGWARTHAVLPLMPRARLDGDDLYWDLVHGYTGEVLSPSRAPSGSEVRGTR